MLGLAKRVGARFGNFTMHFYTLGNLIPKFEIGIGAKLVQTLDQFCSNSNSIALEWGYQTYTYLMTLSQDFANLNL